MENGACFQSPLIRFRVVVWFAEKIVSDVSSLGSLEGLLPNSLAMCGGPGVS